MRKQLLHILIGLKSFLGKKFHKYHDDLPYFITLLVAFIIVVVGINVFIEFTETLKSTLFVNLDRNITAYVISFRNPGLTKIMQFITNVGDIYGYLVLFALCALGFFLKFRNWKYVLQILFVMVIAGLSNVVLKKVFNRARPSAAHLVSVETLSYPSGHAMSAMAFYGFLIYLFYNFKMNKSLKFTSIFLCAFLILAIGTSRIYLGVHFPSDIVGGYIAGFIWVVFCALLFNLIYFFRREKADKKR